MRIVVIGTQGQVARSLVAIAPAVGVEIAAIGRPHLDLARGDGVAAKIAGAAPDLIVNAAAYTAVDRAETEPEAAFAVNAGGAEAVAAAASRLGVPLIHLSTDYVFDGSKTSPYVETDPVAPLGVYGRSKLDGERRVASACPRHIILRTAWVHSPFGSNFVKTMLRLAGSWPDVAVVDDQIGSPTFAPHLAEAILEIARLVRSRGSPPWGIYHAAGSGGVTWCGLAREIFAVSASQGGPVAAVRAITTAEFPTPARRPANSRLDCTLLSRTFGVQLPDWRRGVAACVAGLLQGPADSNG